MASPLAAAAADFDTAAGVSGQSRWTSPGEVGEGAAPASPGQGRGGLVVSLEPSGGTATVPYDPLGLVYDLKRALQRDHGLDPGRQQLWRRGTGVSWELLSDHRLLEREGVRAGDTLRLTLGPAAPEPLPVPTRSVVQGQAPVAIAEAVSQRAASPPDADLSPARREPPPQPEPSVPRQPQQEAVDAMFVPDAQPGTPAAPPPAATSPAPAPGPASFRPASQQQPDDPDFPEARQRCVFTLSYWFMALAAFLLGAGFLITYGSESGDSCADRIERWTVAAGVLHLLSGLLMLSVGVCELRQYDRLPTWWGDLVNWHHCAVATCSFQFALSLSFALAGLIIITRDMTRTERDACSGLRDAAIFLGALSGAMMVVLAVYVCARATWSVSVEAKREAVKEMNLLRRERQISEEREQMLRHQSAAGADSIDTPYISMGAGV